MRVFDFFLSKDEGGFVCGNNMDMLDRHQIKEPMSKFHTSGIVYTWSHT
jgi:hypothetical protein